MKKFIQFLILLWASISVCVAANTVINDDKVVIVITEGQNLISDISSKTVVQLLWDTPVVYALLVIENSNVNVELNFSLLFPTDFSIITVKQSNVTFKTVSKKRTLAADLFAVHDSFIYDSMIEYVGSVAYFNNTILDSLLTKIDQVNVKDCTISDITITKSKTVYFNNISLNTVLPTSVESNIVTIENIPNMSISLFLRAENIVFRNIVAGDISLSFERRLNITMTNVFVHSDIRLLSGLLQSISAESVSLKNVSARKFLFVRMIVEDMTITEPYFNGLNTVVSFSYSHIDKLTIINSIFSNHYYNWDVSDQSEMRTVYIKNVTYINIVDDFLDKPLFPVNVQVLDIKQAMFINVEPRTASKDNIPNIKKCSISNSTFFESDIVFSAETYSFETVIFEKTSFGHPIHVEWMYNIVIRNCTSVSQIVSTPIFTHNSVSVVNLNMIDSSIARDIFQNIRYHENIHISFRNIRIENSFTSSIFKTEKYGHFNSVVFDGIIILNSVIEHLFFSDITNHIDSMSIYNIHIGGGSSEGIIRCSTTSFTSINNAIDVKSVKIQKTLLPYFLYTTRVFNISVSNSFFDLAEKGVGFVLSSDEEIHFSMINITVSLNALSLWSIHNGKERLFVDMKNSYFNVTDKSKLCMIYSSNHQLHSSSNVTIDGDRLLTNMVSDHYLDDGFLLKVGMNTISSSSVQLVFGYMKKIDILYVTFYPFNWETLHVHDYVILPMRKIDVLSEDLWVTVFGVKFGVLSNGKPNGIACRGGFGWDEKNSRCTPCTTGYQQLQIFEKPTCKLDTKLDHLSYMDLDAITGAMYRVPLGFFVLEMNNTVTLVDCMNSFCPGGQVMPGLSGLAITEFDKRYAIYQYNNISISEFNGCIQGHHGPGCTQCIKQEVINGIFYVGYQIISYGCVMIPDKYINYVTIMFCIHCLLLFLAMKNWHLLSKIRWTAFMPKETIVTDFETFEVISTIKNFVLVIYPLVVTTSNSSTVMPGDNLFSFIFKLFFNPLDVFSITVYGIMPYIDVIYYVLFVLFFLFPHHMLSLVELCFCCICTIVFGSLFGIIPMILGVPVAFLIFFNRYRKFFIASVFIATLFFEYNKILIFFPLFIIIFRNRPNENKLFENRIGQNNLLSINYFVLPYMTKLTLIKYFPISTQDFYTMIDRKWHTLASYEGFNVLFLLPLLSMPVMYGWCYMQIRKLADSKYDYRQFLFIVLIGRSFYEFISYIGHDLLPNLLFLIVLMAFIAFAKPFNKLNSLITKVLIVLMLTNLMYEISKRFSVTSTALIFLPSLVVLIKAFQTSSLLKSNDISKSNNYSYLLDL
ncbi:hypothetical protein PCE1_000089 [Barthelona sp. PCE]